MLPSHRIAEKLIYGDDGITTGAGSDLRKATEIARDMVIEQGMGQKLRDQVFHEDNGGLMFDKMTRGASCRSGISCKS